MREQELEICEQERSISPINKSPTDMTVVIDEDQISPPDKDFPNRSQTTRHMFKSKFCL
jgi:hypothetical protein